MSHYPYQWPYGQYQGHPPPPPPPQQFGYQPVEGYATAPPPQHAYNLPYDVPVSVIDANRHATQGSFNHNAGHIPGLATAVATPTGNPFNAGPEPSPWAQQSHYPVPAPNFHLPQHAPPQYSTQNSHYMPANEGPNVAVQTHEPEPIETTLTASIEMDMEEGELSEGQFEDLYDTGQETRPNTAAKPLPRTLASNLIESQPTSATDTPDAGFYADEENETTSKSDEARERSTSYSPFLSPPQTRDDDGPELQEPGVIPQDDHYRLTSSDSSGDNNAARRAKSLPSRGDADFSNATGPDMQSSTHLPTGIFAKNAAPDSSNSDMEYPKDYLKAFKSLTEAKKEAQKAILRLWPLGVKYPNYIEQGFDEKVIKKLFGDLHLELPKEATPPEARKSPVQGVASLLPKLGQTANMQQSQQQQQPAVALKDSAATPVKAGEERKDRIARLLAAKAAKGPAAVPVKPVIQPKPAETAIQSQSTAPAVPLVPKGKPWGEKERILQEKIAALQKSREAQSLKSGAESANVTPATSMPQLDGAAVAITSTNPAPEAQPTLFQLNTTIQGLVASTDNQPHTANQRKRPVAADFVDYPSAAGAHKRPFGKLRKQDSLVIDVSDASDDEEMDMDMGSPIDDTSPIQSRDTSGPRGPSIRDFPPLPDIPRPVLSPAPSQTPPGSLVNGKRHHTELTLKEREIQEMRRKIALAEAKQKAKKSSTPVQRTPELKDSEHFRLSNPEGNASLSSLGGANRPTSQMPMTDSSSIKLTKRSAIPRLDPLQRAERRGRIVSLDLPRVDSSLEEKLRQLEELRAAEERLKAEIDKSREEKELLKEELQQLEAVSEDGMLQDPLDSAPNTEVHATQHEATMNLSETNSSSAPSPSSDSTETSTDVSMDESGSSDDQSQTDSPMQADGAVHQDGAVQESVERDATTLDNTAYVNVATEEFGDHTVSNSEDLELGEVEEAAAETNSHPSRQSVEATLASSKPDNSENLISSTLAEVEPNPTNNDETVPMELDSRSPSPAATSTITDVNTDSDAYDTRQASVPLPEQISSITQPREEVQEIEAEATGEETHEEPAQLPSDTLMPYETPLRIFRAYRFHPDFGSSVIGGLKSLTYSNKIDPQKVFCPYELDNKQCPENCEFQHFNSISIPDDHILLQLGKADYFSDKQRLLFIQGLRELLADFKTNKGRDFDSIAQGIIDYRARFLGDKSKILNLGDVSI